MGSYRSRASRIIDAPEEIASAADNDVSYSTPPYLEHRGGAMRGYNHAAKTMTARQMEAFK